MQIFQSSKQHKFFCVVLICVYIYIYINIYIEIHSFDLIFNTFVENVPLFLAVICMIKYLYELICYW